MAEQEFDKPRLTVTFDDTGENISDGFVSYSIQSSFFEASDAWQFEVSNPDDPASLRRKFRPLRPVTLSIDGTQQVLGRIDGIRGNDNNSNLTVFGRDYLADIVDGSIDPTYKVTDDMDLAEAILGALRPFGITDVFGTNLTRNIKTGADPRAAAPPRDFKAAKVSEFNPGENDGAMEWCTKLVARHGFTIQPAGTRSSLCIIGPNYEQSTLGILRRPLTRNIISAHASESYADVPTFALATGRGGTANGSKGGLRARLPTFGTISYWNQLNKTARINAIISDNGRPTVRTDYFDPDKGDPGGPYAHAFPAYKPLFYTDKDSKTPEQLEAGVRRMISDRLMRTLEYECTVQGTRDPDTGATYAIDTILEVQDGIEDVFEPMWVAETNHVFSRGAMTSMKLIRLGSYVL